MTRHRSREERIRQILEAATELIDEGGLMNLTMDSLALRSGLSKGSVYRFFSNRKAVGLALFEHLYRLYLDFDEEEALSWGLPLEQTISRIKVAPFAAGDTEEMQRNLRVRLVLLAETARDEDYRQVRQRIVEESRTRFMSLVRAIIARDDLPAPENFERRIENIMVLGGALVEGLGLYGVDVTCAEMVERFTQAIHLMVRQAWEEIKVGLIEHGVTPIPMTRKLPGGGR